MLGEETAEGAIRLARRFSIRSLGRGAIHDDVATHGRANTLQP